MTTSERSFRTHINEWGFKRQHVDPATGNANVVMEEPIASTYSMDIAQLNYNAIEDVTMSCHGTMPFDHNIQYCYQDQQNTDGLFEQAMGFRPSSSEHKFDQVLRKVYESSSDCLPKDLLTEEDFFDGSSTFLHFVAAKGRVNEVMEAILGFCRHYGRSLNYQTDRCSTALHVAVEYDRFENVKLLVDAGARIDKVDNGGELPLHVAIRTSNNPQLVAYLLQWDLRTATHRVQKPSEREDRVAMDLAIGRLLQDLADSGQGRCTRTAAGIFQEVVSSLKGMPILEDTHHILEYAKQDPNLFFEAIKTVKALGSSKKLEEIMLSVLGKSQIQNGFGFMHDQGRRKRHSNNSRPI